MNKKLIILLVLTAIVIPVFSHAATLNLDSNVGGIFLGFWHGLLAPYSLVLRWFLPGISMYSCQNASWLYDFGFLIGIFFSLPLGWVAVIVFLTLHLLA